MAAFRSFVWDPALIVAQMVCMQAVFYAVYCLVLIAIAISPVSNLHLSLDLVFPLQTIRATTISSCLASLACSFALLHIVERAKLCLDFAATVFLFHTLFVFLYNHTLPGQISWWLLQVLGTVVATVLGEYLCMRAESREIPLTVPPKFKPLG